MKNTESLPTYFKTRDYVHHCAYITDFNVATKAIRFSYLSLHRRMEKRYLRRGNGATRATQPWRTLLWNFSHSDPLRAITKWLAENVRNIIGARRGSLSFSSRRNVRGTKFLARPRISVGSAENSVGTWYCDLANERSLPKRD